jgi:hypothetical protein
MAYVKRLLLLLAMGSVSVVLAGCYGMPVERQIAPQLRGPTAPADREPVAGLKTVTSPGDTQHSQ